MESRSGAARVRIVEQPTRANNFTGVVEVASRARNMQPVALDFYFDDRRGAVSATAMSIATIAGTVRSTRSRTKDR